MSNPSDEHFQALDRIWKYLVHTKDSKLVFRSEKSPVLTGFYDSDWGGDYPTRKSTTGYLFRLGNTAISWSSKLQSTVALSSCEAEYMALKEAVKELLWLQYMLKQLDKRDFSGKMLYTDSQSAIALAKNPKHHARTKHVDIQYHFVRESYQNGLVVLKYINTTDQLADSLTKAISPSKFTEFTQQIGLVAS